MDDDAQASIIETYAGEGWVNRLTAIRLGRSARAMRAVRLLGGSGFQSMTERAELAEGASLYTSFLGAGGADSRIDVRSELAGEGAFAEIGRSEEHTSELQSLMRISYAVFCLKKKKQKINTTNTRRQGN